MSTVLYIKSTFNVILPAVTSHEKRTPPIRAIFRSPEFIVIARPKKQKRKLLTESFVLVSSVNHPSKNIQISEK